MFQTVFCPTYLQIDHNREILLAVFAMQRSCALNPFIWSSPEEEEEKKTAHSK